MPLSFGDEERKLKQRARRRLIGAIVLVTGLILILPRVLDKESKQPTQDIEVHIPPKDNAPLDPHPAPPMTDAGKASPTAETAPDSAEPTPSEVEPPEVTPPRADPPPTAQSEVKTPSVAASGKTYYIQVGVFSKSGNAQTVQSKLAKTGLRVISSPIKTAGGERMRVRVGPFRERRDADEALAKVKRAGEKNAVIITLEK
ncbi:MAG: SPOR domain-containing protein [Pseudomonadota bacterium]|nr:SPOR domain-containing protein [Pseudomonadota bacterium]